MDDAEWNYMLGTLVFLILATVLLKIFVRDRLSWDLLSSSINHYHLFDTLMNVCTLWYQAKRINIYVCMK